MKATMIEQMDVNSRRFAIVRAVPPSDADPIGTQQVLWEEHASRWSEEDLERVRLEAERQLRFFNSEEGGDERRAASGGAVGQGSAGPGGDGSGREPAGSGNDRGEIAAAGGAACGSAASNVRELPRIQQVEQRVPPEIARDGADAADGKIGDVDRVPNGGPVPGDPQRFVVPGMGERQAAVAPAAGTSGPGPAEVDPPPSPAKATVHKLRPDQMTVQELLRSVADECDQGTVKAECVVIGLFLANGQVKNFVKAQPAQVAFMAAHLSLFAATVSFGPAPEPYPSAAPKS